MFTPECIKTPVESPYMSRTFHDLVDTLDRKFKHETANGWFEHWYKDKIQLVLILDVTGNAVVQYRNELIEHYTKQGWQKVSIVTSKENGERAGLVSITLYVPDPQEQSLTKYLEQVRFSYQDNEGNEQGR